MILNRMLYAATGRTAAEPIHERSDPDRPNMGPTAWKGADRGRPLRKPDVGTARNYLGEPKILSDRPGRSGYSPTPTSCIMIDRSMHEFPDLNRRYQRASRRMAIFAINSMCCAKVALGRHRAGRPDPHEKRRPLVMENRQCAKAPESCSRSTL